MLAIGRALLTNPRLLILDEATEGLAPVVREIWRALDGLKRTGLAVLCIDKNLEPLLAAADRHAIIETGRVAWAAIPRPSSTTRRACCSICRYSGAAPHELLTLRHAAGRAGRPARHRAPTGPNNSIIVV